VIIEKK